MCLRGASAVEEILQSTEGPLRVLVVWEPVIRTDIAPPTTHTLSRLSDVRAMQYWDPERTVSAHLVTAARANPDWLRPQDRARLIDDDVVVWDVALVFPAGTPWEAVPPRPVFYGGPVVRELDAIAAAVRDR